MCPFSKARSFLLGSFMFSLIVDFRCSIVFFLLSRKHLHSRAITSCLYWVALTHKALNWRIDNLTFYRYNNYNEQKCCMFLDFSAFTSLHKVNRTKNCSCSIWNHCFTGVSDAEVFHLELAVVCPHEFHPQLLISAWLSMQRDIAPKSGSTSSNPRSNWFRRGDYVGLYQYVSSSNWYTVLIHCQVKSWIIMKSWA